MRTILREKSFCKIEDVFATITDVNNLFQIHTALQIIEHLPRFKDPIKENAVDYLWFTLKQFMRDGKPQFINYALLKTIDAFKDAEVGGDVNVRDKYRHMRDLCFAFSVALAICITVIAVMALTVPGSNILYGVACGVLGVSLVISITLERYYSNKFTGE